MSSEIAIQPLNATGSEAEDTLLRFLTLCCNWSMDRAQLDSDAIRADESLLTYVADWGRPGDQAVVAVGQNAKDSGEHINEPDSEHIIGAAWIRRLSGEHRGFGWVSDDIPELSIAVLPEYQGHGVGRALLSAICGLARMSGESAISLSVEDGNGSAYLYDQQGFNTVGRNGNSDIMVKNL